MKNGKNKFSGVAKLSDTSTLISLEKNIWDDWEQSPVDAGVWKAEWREQPKYENPCSRRGAGHHLMDAIKQVLKT